MTEHSDPETTSATPLPSLPSRRRVLATSGVVVAAAAVTAACGSSSASTASTSAPAASPAGPISAGSVPVGGGVILTDRKIVVTQPTAGAFKAFSAVCTHQGCVVASVADGKINCACHGSVFSAADGSVEGGPAKSPLAPVSLTVSGDQITLA